MSINKLKLGQRVYCIINGIIVTGNITKMMDKGIEASGRTIISSNSGYNQVFRVSHSRFNNDVSKVAWRII